MAAARAKLIAHWKICCPIVILLFASGCDATKEEATLAATANAPSSRAEVICSYAPSQSSFVSHLAGTAGGAAIAAASLAKATGLTAVLHSSGAYIFTSAGGYVAGTIGTTVALPAIVTVGVAVGGTAATLELVCASMSHPELVSKVKSAAVEFMRRSERSVAKTSDRTMATAKPFIAESKTVVAKLREDAFEYASRASTSISKSIRGSVN